MVHVVLYAVFSCDAATVTSARKRWSSAKRQGSVVVAVAVAVAVAVVLLLLLGRQRAAYRSHGHYDDDDGDDENVSLTRVASREEKEITMPSYEAR